MCYRPLHIKNRKIDFGLYSDPLYLSVPCGKCCDCVKAKHTEWYIRSYYQFIENQKRNGVTIFVTLTYSPRCLPVCDGIPCFSRDDVQKFMKRLRRSLGVTDIKYIVVSEYGGKTHRPHYHALIFFPHLDEFVLKRAIHDSWWYGFVDFGRYGGVVTDCRACGYVSKYVGKDMDFDYKKVSDRSMQPFHLQSHGFGLYMATALNLYDMSDESLETWKRGTCFVVSEDSSSYKQVFIPQYIRRKFTHDVELVDGKVRYVLNDFGAWLRYATIRQRIDDSTEKFTDLKYNVNNILSDENRLAMFNSNLNSHFGTSAEVRSFLGQVSCQAVAIYATLYANRVPVPVGISCDTSVPLLRPYHPKSIDRQISEICWPTTFVHAPHDRKRYIDYLNTRLYNNDFIIVDKCLSIYNGLLYVLGQLAQRDYDEKLIYMSNLKILKK